MQHRHMTPTAHVYHLPLAALIEQMRTAQATLSISAVLPPSVPVATRSEGQEIVAELSFEQGRITRCQMCLRTSGRVLMQQREAFQVLNGVSALPWQIHAPQHDHEAEAAPRKRLSMFRSRPFLLSKRLWLRSLCAYATSFCSVMGNALPRTLRTCCDCRSMRLSTSSRSFRSAT
ncbi:hypothetical protein [Ktedonobacter robiniae]|uniref:hypothetical protein n=1 Tax=Ktedonobacter robiniae TaxID=2778365 RepID=UPI001F438E69|nr:hypothetical protein [Ktedonobacter robiniae]